MRMSCLPILLAAQYLLTITNIVEYYTIMSLTKYIYISQTRPVCRAITPDMPGVQSDHTRHDWCADTPGVRLVIPDTPSMHTAPDTPGGRHGRTRQTLWPDTPSVWTPGGHSGLLLVRQ